MDEQAIPVLHVTNAADAVAWCDARPGTLIHLAVNDIDSVA